MKDKILHANYARHICKYANLSKEKIVANFRFQIIPSVIITCEIQAVNVKQCYVWIEIQAYIIRNL